VDANFYLPFRNEKIRRKKGLIMLFSIYTSESNFRHGFFCVNTFVRVATNLENLEKSGNFKVVRENVFLPLVCQL